MAELKVGYQAVFYKGEEMTSRMVVRENYDQALADIEVKHDLINLKRIEERFTHAQVEKVMYYRH